MRIIIKNYLRIWDCRKNDYLCEQLKHSIFMKKPIPFVMLLIVALTFISAAPISDCRCKGKALYGRVKIVKHHADFNVRIVEHHAHLHVRLVDNHPNSCGKWQLVTHHEDFSVRMVDSHEDFSIKFVDSHPGMQ